LMTIMHLGLSHFELMLFRVCWFSLILQLIFFMKLGKSGDNISSNKFSASFSFFRFSRSLIKHILTYMLHYALQVYDALLIPFIYWYIIPVYIHSVHYGNFMHACNI
jgi:hypothetical protein